MSSTVPNSWAAFSLFDDGDMSSITQVTACERAISVDATEFGKISGVEGLRFNNVLVTANELTQDINDSYER